MICCPHDGFPSRMSLSTPPEEAGINGCGLIQLILVKPSCFLRVPEQVASVGVGHRPYAGLALRSTFEPALGCRKTPKKVLIAATS